MSTDAAARRRAELVLLAITAGWALTFVVVQDALDDADPFAFLTVRFGLAALVGALLSGRALFDPDTVRDALFVGLFLFGGYAFQTVGLAHTTPARSAFLTGLAVLFVPFLAYLRTRRWPRPPVLLGVALAGAGLWILAAPDVDAARDTRLGDLLSVGCAVAFAGHIAFNEGPARRRAALPLVTWQLALVAVLSAVAAGWHGTRFDPTPRLWTALLYCSLFASLAFVGLQTWAQQRTNATRAALVFSLEPACAATYSVLLGRDALTGALVAGGVLLAVAVLVAELGGEAWARRFDADADEPVR